MGLDAVELVLEIEEKFGVTLADDDVVYWGTLGDYHDHLLQRCTNWRRPDCPTRKAFYCLRRAMGAVLHVSPRSLRPSTPLLPLLGRWHRYRRWKHLSRESGLELPELENWAGTGVFWGLCGAGVIGSTLTTILTGDPLAGFAGGLFALLPGVLLGYIIGIFCIPTVAPSFATVGGLARAASALNAVVLRDSEEPPTENDPTWEKLCDIVVYQLGARREMLRRDTRLVDLLA